MTSTKKIILFSFISLSFALQLCAMDAPASATDDERSSGRYHPGRSTEHVASEDFQRAPGSDTPSEQRRKAEKAKPKDSNQPSSEESDIRQHVKIKHADIQNFDRPILIFPEQMHSAHGNFDHEKEAAQKEGELRAIRAAAEERGFVKNQSNPDVLKEKKEFIKVQAELQAEKTILTDRIIQDHRLGHFERDKELASHEVEVAAYKQKLMAQKMVDQKTGDEGSAQQKRLVDAQVSVELHEKMKRATLLAGQEGKDLAAKEAEAGIAKQHAIQKAVSDYNKLPEVLLQKKDDIKNKVDLDAHQRALQAEADNAPGAQAVVENEIKAMMAKQNAMSTERLKPENVAVSRRMLAESAIAQAGATIAVNKFMQENDPNLSRLGKCKNIVEELLIRAAAQVTIKVIFLGAEQAGTRLLELYKQLPLSHAQQLKKHDESRARYLQMLEAEKQFEADKAAKEKMAHLLNLETITIANSWQNIAKVKTLADETQDPKLKEWLLAQHAILTKQWVNALKVTNEVASLNAQNQPHAQPLIQEKIEQMQRAERAKKAQDAQKNQQTKVATA